MGSIEAPIFFPGCSFVQYMTDMHLSSWITVFMYDSFMKPWVVLSIYFVVDFGYIKILLHEVGEGLQDFGWKRVGFALI